MDREDTDAHFTEELIRVCPDLLELHVQSIITGEPLSTIGP